MAKAKQVEVPASILNSVVPIEDEIVEATISTFDRPKSPTDEGWTEYVVSKLGAGGSYEAEKDGKIQFFPTVSGLRGFVDKHFRLTTSSSRATSTVFQVGDRIPTVTVEHHLTIEPMEGFPEEASGVACAGPHNLDVKFPYPAECAETRAEGRAYIKLLRLKTCTKEELAPSTMPQTLQVSGKISQIKLRQLEALCKTLDINLKNFLNSGENKYSSIEDFPSAKFNGALGYLNELQQRQHMKKSTPADVLALAKFGKYVPITQ